MKRIYLIACLIIMCAASMRAETSIFERYADTDGVTTVYISKAMLGMMPDKKANGVNIGAIASKLDYIRILSCEKKGLLPKLRKETQSFGKGYEQLMKVTDDGENVDIFIKSLPEGKNTYLVRVSEESGLTVILISGSITPADIQSMVMNNKEQ